MYQLSKQLSKSVYQLTEYLPASEKFGLSNQIRRAAVSVSLNIAEGTSRFSNKEKVRFVEIAYNSLMEVVACIEIATELFNINPLALLDTVNQYIVSISKMLNALKISYS